MSKKRIPPESKVPPVKGEPQTMEELLQTTGYQLRGFKRGDTVEGTIVSITPLEVLIDIGFKSLGIVSERELDQVVRLLPNLKVGDKIFVQIVSPESEAGQIILSIRRAGLEKKWQELALKKEKEEPIEVSGLEVTRGGLLADWQGLRGFIPASQLNPSRVGRPETGLSQKIKVVVLDVDKATNRLVFSEKRASGEKRLVTTDLTKIKIGQSYGGVVSGIVPFGIFVQIKVPREGEVPQVPREELTRDTRDTFDFRDTSLEGLVHISEIAWEKVANPGDHFKIGDKVKVMVISTDLKTGKFNLSIKQMTPDPWQDLIKKYSLEQNITGKVMRLTNFGVFIELEKGLEGLIHISKIPPGVEFKEGEKVTCVVESIDNQKRKIGLALVLKEKPVGYR